MTLSPPILSVEEMAPAGSCTTSPFSTSSALAARDLLLALSLALAFSSARGTGPNGLTAGSRAAMAAFQAVESTPRPVTVSLVLRS